MSGCLRKSEQSQIKNRVMLIFVIRTQQTTMQEIERKKTEKIKTETNEVSDN